MRAIAKFFNFKSNSTKISGSDPRNLRDSGDLGRVVGLNIQTLKDSANIRQESVRKL
jgi:hypothetical protein